MVNAIQRESPLMLNVVAAPPAPAPPRPAAAFGSSPIGNLSSFAPAAVDLMTSVASPSFGESTYANHFPSLDRADCRMVFHALRSAGSSWRAGPRASTTCCATAGEFRLPDANAIRTAAGADSTSRRARRAGRVNDMETSCQAGFDVA
jgi:hypothetical protein